MNNNMSTADIDKRFHDEYTVKMIRNGRLTTLIAALLTFIPALYLWLVMGYKCEWKYILSGWGIIVSSYFFIYIFEPLGFYPSMGLSGIYVGYLAGNIPTVRLPAMLAARAATGAEAGTHKGELVGVIAIGMSVFVNVAFVTLAAIAGQVILSVLPEFVIKAFNYVLPAILGSVMAQYFPKNKIFVPAIFIICLIICRVPFLPSISRFPLAIVTSIVIGIGMYMQVKAKDPVPTEK